MTDFFKPLCSVKHFGCFKMCYINKTDIDTHINTLYTVYYLLFHLKKCRKAFLLLFLELYVEFLCQNMPTPLSFCSQKDLQNSTR